MPEATQQREAVLKPTRGVRGVGLKPAPRTTRNVRVFHLIKGLGRGGAEILLVEGLRFADRERFTYGYGYFLPWKDAMVPDLVEQGVEVEQFTARSNAAILLSAKRVAAYLRAWNADLLHCHLPVSAVVGRLAGKMAGVPVVYSEHNQWEKHHLLTRWLNRLTWRWQEKAVAVSKEVAASVRGHVGGETPLRVVLNGINVDRFDPALYDGADVRRAWDLPLDAPVVGTAAIFTHQKRLDDWLRAAAHIRRAHPAAHFLIVGDGPLRSELEAQAASLGLSEAVRFAGLQESVQPYLAAMDVYMMSSQHEGFGLALVEAMAMRLPVVTTGVGGVLDIVTHRQNGWLVEAGDAEALAEAASALLEDRGQARALGQAGRATVINRFGIRRMTRELEALYTEVLRQRQQEQR